MYIYYFLFMWFCQFTTATNDDQIPFNSSSVFNIVKYSKASFLPTSCRSSSDSTKLGRCISVSNCREIKTQLTFIQQLQSNILQQIIPLLLCNSDIKRKQVFVCCENHIIDRLISFRSNELQTENNNKNPIHRSNSLLQLPDQDTCGYEEGRVLNRIVGGSPSEQFNWPWLGAVGRPVGAVFEVVCGGSLITQKHVLTAAHCFLRHPDRQITHVRLGDYNLESLTDNAQHADYFIERRVNPNFDATTFKNDIELLTLANSVVLTDNIRIACLPFHVNYYQLIGKEIIVTGWGLTAHNSNRNSPIPLEAALTVYSINNCIASYSGLKNRLSINSDSLCTSSHPSDSCLGDSGSPLHYYSTALKKYIIVGIVSFGATCGDGQFPGVNIKVSRYLPWIRSNIFV